MFCALTKTFFKAAVSWLILLSFFIHNNSLTISINYIVCISLTVLCVPFLLTMKSSIELSSLSWLSKLSIKPQVHQPHTFLIKFRNTIVDISSSAPLTPTQQFQPTNAPQSSCCLLLRSCTCKWHGCNDHSPISRFTKIQLFSKNSRIYSFTFVFT